MAEPQKSELELGVAFDLNAAVGDALAACGGDPMAAVRSLVVANSFLAAQNDALSAELEYAWQQISPGFARGTRTRRMKSGDTN